MYINKSTKIALQQGKPFYRTSVLALNVWERVRGGGVKACPNGLGHFFSMFDRVLLGVKTRARVFWAQ